MQNPIAVLSTGDTLTALNVCLTFVYCILTGIICWAASKQVAAMTRPYLFFGLEFKNSVVEAVLKNTGKSPALDVQLTVDPTLRYNLNGTSGPATLPKGEGFTVPADSDCREFLGMAPDVLGESTLTYTVTLNYKDTKGTRFKETMRISFEHNRGKLFIPQTTAEDSLKKIADTLATIAQRP